MNDFIYVIEPNLKKVFPAKIIGINKDKTYKIQIVDTNLQLDYSIENIYYDEKTAQSYLDITKWRTCLYKE